MQHIVLSQVTNQSLIARFQTVRSRSLSLCGPLQKEDFVVQPVVDVSPPKWHLAHTTWFFEVFVLVPYLKNYKLFHKDYPYLFNSYYVAAGDRWVRAQRGSLTRPTVDEVFRYRQHVEEHIIHFLENDQLTDLQRYVLEVGMQHEQQHQELLLYDIKYILGHNPLFPPYRSVSVHSTGPSVSGDKWLKVSEGVYEIGHEGDSFCFDNEKGRHKVYLHDFEIGERLVTNGEYIAFMNDNGYSNHRFWLSDGWDWLEHQPIKAPMYWVRDNDTWYQYGLGGLEKINPEDPVMHVSFYEADAFAKWKNCRLPTEFEWEVAAGIYESSVPSNANFIDRGYLRPVRQKGYGFYGNLWEWTESAYLPYPYYKAPEGALGEYNGKFMVNQKVLRGGSFATSKDHIRLTYRNFFNPNLQWLFSGFRLARHT